MNPGAACCGVILLSACVAGCGGTAGGDPGVDTASQASAAMDPAADARARLPALHVVLAWEHLVAGRNPQQHDYDGRMAACAEAGWPARPLAAEERARLGTGRVEIMVDARRQRVRQTMWTLGVDEALPAHEAVCHPRLHEELLEYEAHPDDRRFLPLDGEQLAADEALATSIGWRRDGSGQVGGQDCVRWQSDRQEVCMWSGGTGWGIGLLPLDLRGCNGMPLDHYLGAIPLQSKSPDGSGCNLELQSFSLGRGLLPADPSGAGGQ